MYAWWTGYGQTKPKTTANQTQHQHQAFNAACYRSVLNSSLTFWLCAHYSLCFPAALVYSHDQSTEIHADVSVTPVDGSLCVSRGQWTVAQSISGQRTQHGTCVLSSCQIRRTHSDKTTMNECEHSLCFPLFLSRSGGGWTSGIPGPSWRSGSQRWQGMTHTGWISLIIAHLTNL